MLGIAILGAALALASLPSQSAYRSRNVVFETPSGNIVCGFVVSPAGTGGECGVVSGLRPPPPRVACGAGDYTDKRVGLTASGRTRFVTCAGDPGPFLFKARAWVLRYGHAWRAGGIACTSRVAGLTCRNRVGHGFFLSRARWYAF